MKRVKINYIFSGCSAGVEKKYQLNFQVAQQELKRVKHLTAKQAARKKDNEMWEKNRMIRSGQ